MTARRFLALSLAALVVLSFSRASSAQEVSFTQLVDLNGIVSNTYFIEPDVANNVLFISTNSTIRVHNPDGTLNTAYGGDGILGNDPGEQAFGQARFFSFDGTNLYVSDLNPDLIYVVTPATGALNPAVGSDGIIGNDTGGANPEPTYSNLQGSAVKDGVLYIADFDDVIPYVLDGTGGTPSALATLPAFSVHFGAPPTSGACALASPFSGGEILYAASPNSGGPISCIDAAGNAATLAPSAATFFSRNLVQAPATGANCSTLTPFTNGEILYQGSGDGTNELVCIGADGTQFTSNDPAMSSINAITTLNGFMYVVGAIDEEIRVSSSVLPVELVSFRAVPDGRRVVLTWETASETNNAGFEVQTLNGAGWDQLGFVEGAGTSSGARTYRFMTDDLVAGEHRFRLRQVDFDGSATFSGEVEVSIGVAEPLVLATPFPNPAQDHVEVRFAAEAEQAVTLRLYDALGRLVRDLHAGLIEGGVTHRLSVDVSDLSDGRYVLHLRGLNGLSTSRSLTIRR